MQPETTLQPAEVLAALNKRRFPNESSEYRKARNLLLAEEIKLRRQLESVASQRRALPPGGEVPQDYQFVGPNGPVRLSELFGDKQTLVLYSYMFGPQREQPCPMCTSFMSTWEKKLPDVQQKVAIAFVARSPIERLLKAKAARGWENMPVYSDSSGEYTRAYVSEEDEDLPAYSVFTKRDGKIRHFWSSEMAFEMADPGQDPRDAPDPDPLWTLLDITPEGRGADWYPSLNYPSDQKR